MAQQIPTPSGRIVPDVQLSLVHRPGDTCRTSLVRDRSTLGLYLLILETEAASIALRVPRAWLDQFRLEIARELGSPIVNGSN